MTSLHNEAPLSRRRRRLHSGGPRQWALHTVAALLLFMGLGQTRLPALDPTQKPADYIFASWDTETGLPHNSIRKIFQSRDGYIWIGTQQGLARFDGLTFTIFSQHNTPGFPGNQITSIAETRDGSLWVGTSHGLGRYKDGRFTTYLKADGIKSTTGTVNAVCGAPDGSLWIGSQNGITRWIDEKFVQDIDTSAYDTFALRSIYPDRFGAMWIVSGGYALRYKNGSFTKFDHELGLKSAQVQTLSEDAEGNLYAVAQEGLFRFQNERFAPFEKNAGLSSQRLSVAHADKAGNFWIGSVGGLDRIHNGTITPVTTRTGRRFGIVDAILEDREKCLWIGTSSGLYRLTDRRGFSLSTADGITGSLITTIAQTADGALWVGSWGGGIERLMSGSAVHFASGAPLSHETVTYVHQDSKGTIWFGTRGSSIDRWNGSVDAPKVTTFVYQPGVASSRPVTAMYTDDSGEFLIGISKRGLLMLAGDAIVPVPEATELKAHTVWAIHRLRDGQLIIGTSNGVYARQPDRSWRRIEFPTLRGTLVVRELVEEPDGTRWLATEGHGIVRWNGSAARSYGTARGMVDDVLYGIRQDDSGALWVTSSRGTARIRKAEFEQVDRAESGTVNCMTFGSADGLLSGSSSGNGTPSIIRLADGRIMAATHSGVAVIDPKELQTNDRPPNVLIEKAIADDLPLAIDKALIVPPGHNRLEFRYTALSLVTPERLRFRYQLVGSDASWIEAGHARSATYTHLAPGSYTFRVLACNNDGVWNDTGASLPVVIQPHFWQTLAFRLLISAAALGLIAVLVGLRVRQYRAKQEALARTNEELDRRVRDRTAELSRSHDELQQRESLFRLIFEHAPVGISWNRNDLGQNFHFNAAYCQILGLPSNSYSDESYIAQLVHPDDVARKSEFDARLHNSKIDSYTTELRFLKKDGTLVYGMYAAAVVRDRDGSIVQVIGILEDITPRKTAEEELATTYKRLVEVSRASGMAEVATGVLHNVGNVLNSVNVSVSMLADGLRQSKIGGLSKLSTLLDQHSENIGVFLTDDPRGRRVLPYLKTLCEHLNVDHERLLAEVESLRANIEHIKEIVARQQNLARQGGLVERVSASELLESAVEMNAMALVRHGVEVVRDYKPTPQLMVERHKALQVFINLIQNAKEALKAGRATGRQLKLQIHASDTSVTFRLSDNGVGIPQDNLTRIFEHGFSTRQNGHGFGLHASAIAAKQMGGRLTAFSEGIGAGASFTLELPIAQSAAIATVVDNTADSSAPAR